MSTDWGAVERVVSAFPGDMGVWVKRLETGEVWESDGETVFPAASTIKIPVLTTLFRRVEAGERRLDERITFEDGHRAGGSGVLRELDAGLQPTLKDLATLMIIISDNSATNRCIDAAGGFAAVNATMRDLGLPTTELNRYTIGRIPDEPDLRDNLTTPHDLATLLELIWTRRAAQPATCEGMLDVLGRQQLRARLPRWYPETVKHWGKTGTTGRPAEGWACRHDSSLLSTPNGTVAMACLTRFDSNTVDGYDVDAAIGRVGAAVLDALGVERRFPRG